MIVKTNVPYIIKQAVNFKWKTGNSSLGRVGIQLSISAEPRENGHSFVLVGRERKGFEIWHNIELNKNRLTFRCIRPCEHSFGRNFPRLEIWPSDRNWLSQMGAAFLAAPPQDRWMRDTWYEADLNKQAGNSNRCPNSPLLRLESQIKWQVNGRKMRNFGTICPPFLLLKLSASSWNLSNFPWVCIILPCPWDQSLI